MLKKFGLPSWLVGQSVGQELDVTELDVSDSPRLVSVAPLALKPCGRLARLNVSLCRNLVDIPGDPGPGTVLLPPEHRRPRLTVTGDDALVTGVIQSQSDARLKTDLCRIDGALDRVRAMTGYTFAMKKDPSGRHTGLLAQDVAAVLPEATHCDAATGMLSIAYAHMAGLFVQAIKELADEVDELRRHVRAV